MMHSMEPTLVQLYMRYDGLPNMNDNTDDNKISAFEQRSKINKHKHKLNIAM